MQKVGPESGAQGLWLTPVGRTCLLFYVPLCYRIVSLLTEFAVGQMLVFYKLVISDSSNRQGNAHVADETLLSLILLYSTKRRRLVVLVKKNIVNYLNRS